MTERGRPAAFWALALIALAALRLPYLTSPRYILDNDEAVLGIMARHAAAGDGLPLYFAGQRYGLSVFETLPLAAAFKVFGDSSMVLALTMVALFSVGLLGYSRAFRNLAGSVAWARVLTIVLALIPGWIVWSTKARGIYVSGFALTGFALALLTKPETTRREVLAAGALMGLVGLGQPLWLSVTLPFLLLGRRPWRDTALAALTFAVLWLAPTVLARGAEAFWEPRPFEGFGPTRMRFLPQVLVRAFSGRVAPHEPGVSATLIGVAGELAFFVLMTTMAVDALRRRSRLALAAGIGMCLSVVHLTVLRVWVPRYFLPCTVLTLAATAIAIGARSTAFTGARRWAPVALIAVLSFTAVGLNRPSGESRLAAVPAQDDMRTLIASLEADGVRGVYAQTTDIEWQILFYGDERIPARGRTRDDRYPRFPRAVAEARGAGLPTAYVADIRQLRRDLPTDSFPGYRVGERYLRLDDPEAALLFVMGFQLNLGAEAVR